MVPDNKILCILAGYDLQTESRLAGFQQELYRRGFSGVQTKDIFMHITLGSFSPADEEMLVEKMKRAAGACAPFDVHLSHIGIFDGTGLFVGTKVLFVAPDVNRDLLTLKEHFGPSESWTPHSTLLIDRPETVFSATPVVFDSFQSFRGRVTSLHLYEFWPTHKILSLNLNGCQN